MVGPGPVFLRGHRARGRPDPISSAVVGGPLSLRDAFFSLGYQKTYGLAGYGQLSYELVTG